MGSIMDTKKSIIDEWGYLVKRQLFYFRNVFCMEKEDLKQEIIIGLIIGIQTYREGETDKAGYLINRIRHHVLRQIENTGRLVRIPSHINYKILKATKIKETELTEDEELLLSKGRQAKVTFDEEYMFAWEEDSFSLLQVQEVSDIINKHLSTFLPAQREVFIRHYLEETPLKDVAIDMEITIKQARSHRNNLIPRLRKIKELRSLVEELR